MTTPTSSTKKVRLGQRDFLYALGSPKTWLLPLLLCILAGVGGALLLWLPAQLMDDETRTLLLQNYTYLLNMSAFGGFLPSIYSMYPVFLFFGIIAAFAAFDFCFSKTKAGAFLSFALPRSVLFCNRLLASLIWFAAGTLLTQICMTAVQLMLGFSISGTLMTYLGYTTLLLFLETALGLMIGALAVSICHNVPEGIFTAVCLSACPYALVRLAESAGTRLLNGYGNFIGSYAFGYPSGISQYGSVLNPLACVSNIPVQNADGTYTTTGIGDFSALAAGEKLVIPSTFWAILAVLAAYCIVCAAAGILTFPKKQFENLNARMPNARCVGIGVFTFGTVLAFTLSDMLHADNQAFFWPLVSAIVILVLLVLLAVRKKFKALGAAIAVPVCVTALCFAGFAAGNTQYENVIPAADDIACAYVSESGESFVSKNSDTAGGSMVNQMLGQDYLSAYEDPLLGSFTSESDLKAVQDVHRTLIEDSKTGSGTASVYYRMKDGSTVMRTYTGLSKSAMEALDALYDTEAVRNDLIYRLTANSAEEIEKFNKTYKTDFNKITAGRTVQYGIDLFSDENQTADCTSPEMLEDYMRIYALCQTEGTASGLDSLDMTSVDLNDLSEAVQSYTNTASLFSANLKREEPLNEETAALLKTAVAADIKANGRSYILPGDEKPQAILCLGTSNTVYDSTAATVPGSTFTIGIYPSMKNTLQAIASLGMNSILRAEEAVQKIYAVDLSTMPQETRQFLTDGTSRRFTGSYSTEYDKSLKRMTAAEAAENFYYTDAESDFVPLDKSFDIGVPLSQLQVRYAEITDAKQMEELLQKANILADSNGDNWVLLAVYDDFTMTAYNLDEADAALLDGVTMLDANA